MSFQILRLTGRCSSGHEHGAGVKFHAVPDGKMEALCGATYGRMSAGGSTHAGEAVTCPRCLKALEKEDTKLREKFRGGVAG